MFPACMDGSVSPSDTAALRAEIAALRAENKTLKDELARLRRRFRKACQQRHNASNQLLAALAHKPGES